MKKLLLLAMLLSPAMALAQQSIQGTPNGYPVAITGSSGSPVSVSCATAACPVEVYYSNGQPILSTDVAPISAASGAFASGALASGSVASGAIASGAVASGAIASGAIASGAVASGAVSSGAFAAGAMAAQSFAVGAIPPAAGTLASGAVTSAMTGTTSTSVIGSTASNRIYTTWCVVSNGSLTVSTDILLQDGSGGTTLAVLPAPAAAVATTGGGGAMIVFPTPLTGTTAGNALFAANVTNGSSTKITCGGFKSTVSY